MINKEIDYVTEVAETGSILKASEKLFISSSALSKYIQNLETRLDVKLFDRIGKKFVLTYAGERYLYWIRRQQILLQEMESELADIASSVQGTVRIATPHGFSDFFIQNVLGEFHHQYPNVKIQLIEDTSVHIMQMVANNEIDFALMEELGTDSNLSYEKIYEETVVMIASKENAVLQQKAHPNKEHKYLHLASEDCKGQKLIMTEEGQNMTRIINEHFQEITANLDTAVTVRSILPITQCVAMNIGVAITTDFSVFLTGNQDQVNIYSIGDRPVNRTWSIIHHKNHYLPEHAKKLESLILNVYTRLAKDIQDKYTNQKQQ